MKKDKYNVAIIGSTGAVGQEMIEILGERNFPIGELSPSCFKKVCRKRAESERQHLNRPGTRP